MLNGVWKEEAKIVPADGSSGDWLGYDVDISGVTDIIRYPSDNDMGIENGYVYVFFQTIQWKMGGGTETYPFRCGGWGLVWSQCGHIWQYPCHWVPV